MQNHYNLVTREEEREMIPFCIDQGVGVIPWSPLARGFLAAKHNRDRTGDTKRSNSDGIMHNLYYSETDFEIVDCVAEVAASTGVSQAQVALAWMLQKPGITSPIIGATKLNHLEEAVAALDVKLTAEAVAQLEAPYQPKRVLEYR
jgi:aryl-alcohol dehydrogenase (NADP+)